MTLRAFARLRRHRVAVIGLAGLVIGCLGACSDEERADTPGVAASSSTSAAVASASAAPSTAPAAPSTAPTSPATALTTAAPTSAPTTAVAPASSPPPPTTTPPVGNPVVTSERIASLDAPVGLAVRPGDAALYVVERGGNIVQLPDLGAGPPRVVAELGDGLVSGGEQGLLGLAFGTDGALAYVDYTDRDGDTVVSEIPVAADGSFDTSAERILLTIDQPYPNHNGGDVAIGPDGMLYVAMGDGGAGGDPERRASDPTQLLGTLLRIDPTAQPDAAYSIPPDNPFADGEHNGRGGAAEVWAWGLRNPWRIAFDPNNGDLWIADVGQNEWEEIDVVSSTDHPAGWGANFGWSAYEADVRFNDDVADPGDTVFPVYAYSHSVGCSVSGGAVYRSPAIAELAGAYVYSDYCAGTVWAFDPLTGRNLELLDGFSEVAAVRSGPDGELYVLEVGGGVHRLIPA